MNKDFEIKGIPSPAELPSEMRSIFRFSSEKNTPRPFARPEVFQKEGVKTRIQSLEAPSEAPASLPQAFLKTRINTVFFDLVKYKKIQDALRFLRSLSADARPLINPKSLQRLRQDILKTNHARDIHQFILLCDEEQFADFLEEMSAGNLKELALDLSTSKYVALLERALRSSHPICLQMARALFEALKQPQKVILNGMPGTHYQNEAAAGPVARGLLGILDETVKKRIPKLFLEDLAAVSQLGLDLEE